MTTRWIYHIALYVFLTSPKKFIEALLAMLATFRKSMYRWGGEEDGHEVQDDSEAEVLDGPNGQQLPNQLLLVHAHKKLKIYNKPIVKKST